MRKFIQWGLIAAVAVGSIGVLAHGLFTESTGRAAGKDCGAGD